MSKHLPGILVLIFVVIVGGLFVVARNDKLCNWVLNIIEKKR
ncbi:MAG: hypothetical protein HW401_148 [Parcubacteria group bacterium]|nr:hypothetical protein [Parcubacteria group bacterium]